MAADLVRRACTLAAGLGAASATLANLGCCGAALLGPGWGLGAAAAVLAAWVGTRGYEAMYAAFAAAVSALAVGAWHRRNRGPLAVGLAGVGALALAFHESWDVGVFAALVSGGLGAVLAAVGAEVRRGGRGCRGRSEGAPCAT